LCGKALGSCNEDITGTLVVPPETTLGLTSSNPKTRGPCPLTPGPYNQSVRIAYLDAFSGISGDMTVGSSLDAGAPAEPPIDALKSPL
jgi:hypothetical protein